MYQNSGNSNNWIKVKLIGETSNRSLIGAKVKITKGTKIQYRYISSLTGFNGQNELTVIIGLGLSTIINEIEIKWPQGEKVTFTNIAVNQEIEVSENDENLGIEEYTVSSIYIYH